MSTIEFKHTMAAHCETGTIAATLTHSGCPISEPMVLGIAGGIFFAYLSSPKFPFPMFVTRSKPGDIRKKIAGRIGAHFWTATYRDPLKAQRELDDLLGRGFPVSAQVDMFYMEYIPRHMKVHFNGHFVTIIGREGDRYRISDSYYPTLTDVSSVSLGKGRFAKGDLAPKGFAFYPDKIPSTIDYKNCIIAGIKDSCRGMLHIPVPFAGIKGMRLFARKLLDWPRLAGDPERLSHELMMINVTLEEKGTGGAGFRFMFATFLQESATLLNRADLGEMAARAMAIGDQWRAISLKAARIGKSREMGEERLRELQQMILARADEEEVFFKDLEKMVK